MLGIMVVVAPILFVLLTTVAILSFAPVDEKEPSVVETGLNRETEDLLTQGEDGKVILFRPAAMRLRASASADDLVAHLEQDLRHRYRTAQEQAAESSKDSAAAS